jgi:hypothetical protein
MRAGTYVPFGSHRMPAPSRSMPLHLVKRNDFADFYIFWSGNLSTSTISVYSATCRLKRFGATPIAAQLVA